MARDQRAPTVGNGPARAQFLGGPARAQVPAADREGAAADEHAGLSQRLARSPFGSFIPWILFWVIGGPSTWETATIAALLAAALLTLMSIRRPIYGRPGRAGMGGDFIARHDFTKIKLLDAATVLFFAALLIVALVTSRHDVAQLDKYSQALSSGALGLIALGSIVARHPFTVDYAKETTSPQLWHTAVFRHINLVLTWVWAVVFLVCGGLGLLSVHVHTKGVQDLLNWYIPIALIVAGVWLNSWYPHRVRARLQQRAGRPAA
jgi:hypothetical protein